MKISDDLVQKLSNAGTMASFAGLPAQGKTIMAGVRAVRPDNIHAAMGHAIALINANEMEHAIGILEQSVLSISPDNLQAKCFLGFALKQAGREEEGQWHLQDVLARCGDEHPAEKEMAELFLTSPEAT